ncbi:MAG: SoxR reducing system RseC family protein [bacterium]
MIETPALVTERKSVNRYCLLPQPQNTCGSCGSQSHCAGSALASIFPNRQRPLEISSDLDLEAGDSVTVGIEESLALRLALQAYLLPIVLLIVGAITGHWISHFIFGAAHETIVILAGLIGMVLGFVVARRVSNKTLGGADSRIVIIKKNTSPLVGLTLPTASN